MDNVEQVMKGPTKAREVVILILADTPQTIMAAANRYGADATINTIDLVSAALGMPDLVEQVSANPHLFRLTSAGLEVRARLLSSGGDDHSSPDSKGMTK